MADAIRCGLKVWRAVVSLRQVPPHHGAGPPFLPMHLPELRDTRPTAELSLVASNILLGPLEPKDSCHVLQ